MSIKIGNLDVSSFKVGSADCRVYLGDTLMYPQSQTSYKLVAEYSDSSEYKIECDATSALTAAEVTAHTTPKSAMTEATIGDCVTELSSNTFSSCSSLTSCTIPSGVTTIGYAAFDSCESLTSIDIPSSITSIEFGTFYNCISLSSVNIPSGVTSIGSNAFNSCTSLTSIDIPSGVTSIGEYAFYNCSSLTGITVNATTPPTLGDGALDNTNDCPIYVPSESVNAYYDDEQWGIYDYRIEAI